MFQAARTRIALAAATLAIVATSFAPAAATFAAPLQPERLNAGWQPDIFVKAGPEPSGSTFSFLVGNIGNMDSGIVTLKGECSDVDGHKTIGLMKMLPHITQGSTMTVYVNCPSATWGARLTASTQNDKNTKNNIDQSGAFF